MSAEKPGRILSLDALRGFDMFFITGGAIALAGVGAALGAPDGLLATQMRHVEWEGLAHHDTIFPLFLFLAGVTWPLSRAAQIAKGRTTPRIQAKIILRAAILFLLGFSFGGILKFRDDFRLMGVLQFIGPSWGIAATLWLHVKRKGILAAVAAALLAVHYAALHFCIAPGAPADAWSYAKEWNVFAYLDNMIWPTHIPKSGCEPESLFELPVGVALALFGMFAGSFLRRGGGKIAGRDCAVLAGAGAAFGVAALLSVALLGDPIVKKLWTTSFILAAAAYSLFMLALFAFVVDVLGWRKWTVVFDPVGKNSILAYMTMMTGVMTALQQWLFAGLCDWAGKWGAALSGFTCYLVVWTLLRFLGKKGVYLKV